MAREIRVIRAAVDSEERTRRPLTLSFARTSSSSETGSERSRAISAPMIRQASSTLSSRVPT